jgi:protein SCO1
MNKKQPVSYLSLAITAATGGGLFWFYTQERDRRLEAATTEKSVVVGRAALGGPFELIDTRGRKFTDADLKGSWSMLYFGFTHCPDVCPEELEKVATAIDLIEKQTNEAVIPVFITVDPERDGVAQVKEYVSEFHPRMVGLTGSPEATRAAAKAYRVYAAKAGGNGKDDYLVDHSIITYLLDPEGVFVAFYGKNNSVEEMVAGVRRHMEAWRQGGKKA